MVGSALRGNGVEVIDGSAVSVRRQWITRVWAAALSVQARCNDGSSTQVSCWMPR
jgi:hypothetical protein